MAFWTFLGLAKGKATTGWPADPGADDGQHGVLGMPRLKPELCEAGCEACASVCPTRAIALSDAGGSGHPAIDYGRCVVCQLCVEACPTEAMSPSSDWAFGVRNRDNLWSDARHAGVETPALPAPHFARSLHIRHVDAGSCNGCESELQALGNPFYNLHRLGIFFTPSPRFADLLLVTGPVTHAMKNALRATYDAMPEPRWVMAVGTCAVSGGIAEGGYACGHGLEGVLPVDLYLPGCPPNPAALIEALLMFLGRTEQRMRGGNNAE
jgi:Ni,Fe-hydrogenase III small subunit/Pyruvate/2-oxoacid:ferredoxin oxidoreductase delta subunit